MTTEVASVVIMIVVCATAVYFVREYMKTLNDENIDILYRYTFKFLVEYSRPYGGIINYNMSVTIIDNCYSKALQNAIPELIKNISDVSTKYDYVLNNGWLIRTYREIVK